MQKIIIVDPLHIHMLTFNEWVDESDDDLVGNQLRLMVDRVVGLVYDLSADEKKGLLEQFIKDVKERVDL